LPCWSAHTSSCLPSNNNSSLPRGQCASKKTGVTVAPISTPPPHPLGSYGLLTHVGLLEVTKGWNLKRGMEKGLQKRTDYLVSLL
jgi:hypothetical protein